MTSNTQVRVAEVADLPAITIVRTSVVENHLSVEQLLARGITEASIAASFLQGSKGWVAVADDRVVGFAIADRMSKSLFALFVLPGHEGLGLGSALLQHATDWLFSQGVDEIWLTTGSETRAASFYRRRGWREVERDRDGELRMICQPVTVAG